MGNETAERAIPLPSMGSSELPLTQPGGHLAATVEDFLPRHSPVIENLEAAQRADGLRALDVPQCRQPRFPNSIDSCGFSVRPLHTDRRGRLDDKIFGPELANEPADQRAACARFP